MLRQGTPFLPRAEARAAEATPDPAPLRRRPLVAAESAPAAPPRSRPRGGRSLRPARRRSRTRSPSGAKSPAWESSIFPFRRRAPSSSSLRSLISGLELLALLVELAARDAAHPLEVHEALLEHVGGGLAALDCLDAEEHLVLGRVGDRVAAEGDGRVLQYHVLEGVAQRVRFAFEDEGPAVFAALSGGR